MPPTSTDASRPATRSEGTSQLAEPEQSSTFGPLGKRWHRAVEWAKRNQVDDVLPLLIDTFRLAPYPDRLGTVLAAISGDLPAGLLRAWADEDEAPNQLFRLAHATRVDRSIFQVVPLLSVGASARTQLTKGLKDEYVFAVVLEHMVPFDPSQIEWLLTLRTWIVVMAVDRAMRGNVRDHLIRKTCDAIRRASDRNAEWGAVLSKLEGPTDDLGELCAALERSAKFPPGENVPANKRSVLSAIRRIAAGEESPDGAPSSEPLLFAPAAQNSSATKPWFDPPGAEPEGDPEELIPPASAADGASLIRSFRLDPNLSSARQLNDARSVYLLDAAALHFLPWEWYKVAPFEKPPFRKWITQLQGHNDIHHRLTGLFASLCHRSGRSLAQLLGVELSDSPSEEWRLASTLDRLHRARPSRASDWTPKTGDEINWVAMACDQIEIRLSPLESRILKEAMLHGRKVGRLADFWHADDSPRKYFLQLLPPELERLTPGMLSTSLRERLFEETTDPLFARVISSSPRSGLPGACAYANWHQDTVNSALNGETPDMSPKGEWVIGGGSRLDPIESLIKSSIKSAATTLEALRKQDNFIAFHNAYATYLTMALWAATGSRANKDPFESITHFDLVGGFAYLDDKSVDGTQTGRIVPLPKTLCRMVDRHRRYLGLLADRLATSHAGLSERIAELTTMRSPARMPFLFMLQQEGAGLTWASVTPESMETVGLFKWPLPPNLFRQRLAKVLRRLGLDAEIVDGLLGHSEFGCATYSDDSPRIWNDDMAAARPIVEAAFKRLEFPDPLPPALEVDLSALKSAPDIPERAFGIAARAQARQERLAQVRVQAESAIKEFLKGAELTSLDEEQLWELSKLLLLKTNGLPRPTGFLRYGVMIEQLETAWKAQGKRSALSRRFIRLKRPTSRFTAEGIQVKSWHGTALDIARRIITERRTSLSDEELPVVGALLLCLEGRVADPRVLLDVACRQNCQVTHFRGEYDLDYAPQLGSDDVDSVVQRFPVSRDVAACLTWGAVADPADEKLAKRAERFPDRKLPRWLDGLARTIPPARRSWSGNPTYGEIFRAIAHHVDQFNAQSLPGPLAAWYAGREPSAALTRRDRVRLATGRIPLFKETGSGQAEPHDLPDPIHNTSIITGASADCDGPALHSAAHAFFAALSATLLTSETGGTSELTGKTRKALGAEINRTIREWCGKVSTAVLLLGQWISALVRGKTSNKRIRKLSAVQRYLGGLAPAFRDIAYASDLLAMDDEDVTILYADMIASRTNQDTRAFADRLQDFHRWAATLGVEDPDWSEMPVTMATARRSPGLLSETDYQKAMQLLAKDPTVEPALAARRAFLLMACYRFGLRRRECVGLARSDLVIRDGALVALIVRKHPWRSLKTSASRRLVPALFPLAPAEQRVLTQVLAQAEASHADRQNVPLLMEPTDNVRLVAASLAHPLQAILKALTGSGRTTLHHARHTAANRIASAALRLEHGLFHAAWKGQGQTEGTCDIEGLLLGRPGPNRSQSWAIARYLGHAGTRTLWRSYLHINDLWARQFMVRPATAEPFVMGRRLIDLDHLTYSSSVDTGLLEDSMNVTTRMTFEASFRLFRLLARGKPLEEAAPGLSLHFDVARRAADAVARLGRKVQISTTADGQSRDNADGYALLRRIPERRWSELIDWAKSKRQSDRHTSLQQDEALNLLYKLTGVTGQLLMWRPEHAKFLREFLEFAGLGDSDFEVRRTARWHPVLDDVLGAGEFTAVHHRAEGDKKQSATEKEQTKSKATPKKSFAGSFEIDAAPPAEDGQSPSRRAALVLRESTQGVVRNKLELLVALTAYVVADGAIE